MKKLLVLGLIASPYAAAAQDAAWRKKTEPAKGLTAIFVHSSAGGVEASTDPKAASMVIEKVGEDKEEACRFVVKRGKSQLVVTAENRPGTRVSCKVGWRVKAPENVALTATAGSGPISLRGFAGPVSARSGSGAISVDRLGGETQAKTGSGEIRGSRLSGDFTGTTGSGDVKASFTAAPSKIEIETGSGDVTVTLPKGSSVDWKLKTGSGDASSAFGADKNGKTKLDARAGSGDIKIVESR